MATRAALPLLLTLAAGSAAGASGGYVGASACAGCHPSEAKRQSATGHAVALRRTREHPLAAKFFPPKELARAGGFRFEFLPGPSVRISGMSNSVEAPLEWAFGAGVQAVTFVSRVDRDRYIEHFFSFYTLLDGLRPTPGQAGMTPNGLGEAAGLYYKTHDSRTGIEACFQCHSTGELRWNAEGVVEPAEPGVRCESCHGPGERHVAAAKANLPSRQLIENPARLSAAGQLRFCGRCHREPAPAAERIDWSYAWNVRHQPVYLAKSACFLKSAGALSCTTCHSPHGPLEQAAAVYNERCRSCHAAPPAACQTNCVDCHMPRVSPQSPLRFTNHWIGIYDGAAKLRPRY